MNVLIKNGRIWDGEKFFFGDILTEDSKILKIAEHIDAEARFTFDVAGKIVSAGLVDIHVHMRGISSDNYGISTDLSCIPFGVTTACDGGGLQGDEALLTSFTVKSMTFASAVIENNNLNVAATEARFRDYGSRALGLKLFFDTSSKHIVNITPLQQVCDLATKLGCKVLVHCAHSPTTMEDVVRTLRPGDILTHIYHGNENICADNDYAALRLAREKGVVLDAGFAGNVHTDSAVFKRAIAAGQLPDTISTDITFMSAFKRGGRYGLPMCMSMARAAGMEEDTIFRAVTSAPAHAIGMEEKVGFLKEGGLADIAVLDYTAEGFRLENKDGASIESEKGYRCVLTLANGVPLYCD